MNFSTDIININRIYVTAIIVSLIFLVFGIAFVIYAGNITRDDTIDYIKHATKQTKLAINEHIDEEFDTLMASAIFAQSRDVLTDDSSLYELEQALDSHNAYVLIGFADTKGNAAWIDQEGRKYTDNVSDKTYFKQAKAGKNTLADGQDEKFSNSDVFYFSVPVYDGNTDKVKGVIFAAEPHEEFSKIIDNYLYAGQGLAHIIDKTGEYILKSDSPLVIGIGTNIFELETPLSKEKVSKILGDLNEGNSGYLERESEGENRMVAYTPMNINDWSVFYAVPEDLVSEGPKKLTMGVAIIVCAATCVFILFILLIRIVNNRNRSALEELAFVDPVTGGRNYQKFLMDAEEILRSSKDTHYAVCYTNIKGFKYINDIFGRDVGDNLLRYYSDVQAAISQEGEVVGHLSGDSFVALRKFNTKKDVLERFESSARQLSIFPETFSKGYKVEAYGGAYALDKADGDLSINDMLDRAMAAQKEVRAAGGSDRVYFYSGEMREEKIWEAEIEAQMEIALEKEEFQVYLQPKIDIQHDDSIMGAEALVRWDSPELGFIPPGRFINLFEANGFILKLDRYVFETACKFYSENVLTGILPDFILSVNVSRLGLLQPNFINYYTAIKEKYNIPDGCIELEFTESLAVENYELLEKVIASCKRYGFLCSMDDFGSGFSSLNMLKSVHVDILKLDRQFFLFGDEAQRGQKLIKYIIKMAKSLGMKTVAEGIDEASQVRFLREAGCDVVQGYIFARPMSMGEFRGFVKLWNDKL